MSSTQVEQRSHAGIDISDLESETGVLVPALTFALKY